MPSRTVTVASRVGLHARPASLFVQAVTATGLPVTIAKSGGDPVDARSILMVMGLAVGNERRGHADRRGRRRGRCPRPAGRAARDRPRRSLIGDPARRPLEAHPQLRQGRRGRLTPQRSGISSSTGRHREPDPTVAHRESADRTPDASHAEAERAR